MGIRANFYLEVNGETGFLATGKNRLEKSRKGSVDFKEIIYWKSDL
jgi:hypothetical protein